MNVLILLRHQSIMKAAATGFMIFALSWALAFAGTAWFGVHTYPQSVSECLFTGVCLLVFGLGLWLIVHGFGKLKTA